MAAVGLSGMIGWCSAKQCASAAFLSKSFDVSFDDDASLL
jgi:hypothetical protein